MIPYIFFFIMLVLVIMVNFKYYQKPNYKKLFTEDTCTKINLSYANLFCVNDIARQIHKRINKTPFNYISINYKDIEYIITKETDFSEIKDTINNFQMNVVQKYEDIFESDNYSDVILGIWLLYSQNNNYRKNFLRILNTMYEEKIFSEEVRLDAINAFYF